MFQQVYDIYHTLHSLRRPSGNGRILKSIFQAGNNRESLLNSSLRDPEVIPAILATKRNWVYIERSSDFYPGGFFPGGSIPVGDCSGIINMISPLPYVFRTR